MTDPPSVERARRAAVSTVAGAGGGPAGSELAGAEVGRPRLVSTVSGTPSYHLVPLALADGGHGFIRVGPDGNVQAAGRYGGSAPATMDRDQVLAMATAALRPGERAEEPRLVHDGPPGREAWLVVVAVSGTPSRWLFVSPGGVHERPPSEQQAPGMPPGVG